MRDAAAMGQRQGGDEGDGDGDGDGDPPTSSSLRRVVMVDSNLLCTRLNHESERNAHILNKNGVTTIIFPSAILWTYTYGTNILKKARSGRRQAAKVSINIGRNWFERVGMVVRHQKSRRVTQQHKGKQCGAPNQVHHNNICSHFQAFAAVRADDQFG